MASLERRNDTYRIIFMFCGKKYAYSLGTADKPTAEALRGGVEKTLMLLGQGLLQLPPGSDIIEFVRSDGKIAQPFKPLGEATTLATLREAYLETQSNGVVEASSLKTIRIHLQHFASSLGEQFPMATITLGDVQRYIDKRLGQKHRGKRIGPVTVKKEVTTLRAAWNWGIAHGLVAGLFPSKGLKYPKTDAKPPFMTLEEIERKIAIGGLSPTEQDELYESLYLRREEITALLDYVRQHAAYPWVYPMICVTAHTGARRSELLRMEVTDVDLERSVLLVREKKRSKKQRTMRHVSMTPFLTTALQDWLRIHPGGRYLFCQTGTISRSNKRSATTGHLWGAKRPTSERQRQATVVKRMPIGVTPVTKDEASDHFKRTLQGSRWEAVRGFHVLRHSFISCLAAAGVDQRIIDEFVGHCTDEQRRRYRHLIPDVKHQAIATAFGVN